MHDATLSFFLWTSLIESPLHMSKRVPQKLSFTIFQVNEQEHTLEKDSAASRMNSLNPSASFYVRNRGSNVNVSGGGGGNGLSDTAPKFLLLSPCPISAQDLYSRE